MRSAAFILLLILSSTGLSLHAQPVWVAAHEESALSFEWEKPFLSNSDGVKFLNSIFFLGYRTHTSEALSLIVDLPFSNYSTDAVDEYLLGNPYVGLAFGEEDALISGDVGVRLPIADKDKWVAASFGAATDIDRLEAFATEAVPAMGLLRMQTGIPGTDLGVRAHAGPSILVFMNDRGDEVMDVFLKYGLILTYDEEGVFAQLGYSGVYAMRHELEDVEGEAASQIGITVNADVGAHFWPGLLLRFPLDNYLGKGVDAIFGVNLLFRL
ncbi:hypothetical protein KQI65_10860 [bacterium]|nr:hypothetical protein [bacterium]